MNEALIAELGRANVKLLKNALVDGIRQSIIHRLETLRKLDHRMDIDLARPTLMSPWIERNLKADGPQD